MAVTNRLIHIVDLINTSITDGFITKDVKAHGLVRLEPRQGQVIPQKYKGFGDAEFVFEDKSALVIYHRLTGTSKDKDDSQSFGTKSLITETYSLKMILFGDKRKLKDNTEDIDYEISETIDLLIPNRLSTVTLNNINARSGVISSTSIDNNKVAVFGEEFPDLDYKLKPENILSSIDYEIELTFDSDCKDIACPPGDALIDLTKISCANLNDSKFGLTASQIEDCSICDPATITDSNGVTTFEVASGRSGACTIDIVRKMNFRFGATGTDVISATIEADQVATYTTETLTNVATVVYKVNTVVQVLPFSVVNTDTLEVTITRTVAATLSRVVLIGS